MILAGRGFGKTLAGAQWITTAIEAARCANDPLRIALVGATMDDARRVMRLTASTSTMTKTRRAKSRASDLSLSLFREGLGAEPTKRLH